MVEGQKALLEKQEVFETACREAGLKLTHQRLEVFRELALSEDHPSVETLFGRLKKKLPTLSMDTVYRTLSTMEKHGLVSRVQTVESQARFEVDMEKHHHAICRQCGEITDFIWSSFDEASLPEEIQTWGDINKKNATIYGLCTKCADKATGE